MWNYYSDNYKKAKDQKKKNISKSSLKPRFNNIIENNFKSQNNPNNFRYNIQRSVRNSNNENMDQIIENKNENILSRSWGNISNKELEPIKSIDKFNIRTYDNNNPKGLSNIGATCYMNATLQCFYHCRKLTQYLVNNKYLEDSIIVKSNSITSEYINLVKELSYKDGKVAYSPDRFKEILGRENPLFRGIAANDSKDLILFLEQVLARELTLPDINHNKKKNVYQQIDQTNENYVLQLFLEDFKEERSIIKDIFYFISKTKCFCLSCKNTVYNFQVNNFLIFPLEKTYYESISNSNNNTLINYTNNDKMNIENEINNVMNNINKNTMLMRFNSMNMNNNNILNNINNNLYNNNYSNKCVSHNNLSSNIRNNFLNNYNVYNKNNKINNNYNSNNYINNNFNDILFGYNNYNTNNMNNINNKNLIADSENSKNKKSNKDINLFRNSNKAENKIQRLASDNIYARNIFNNNNFYNNNFYNRNGFLLGSVPNDHALSLYRRPKPKVTLDQCFQSYLKPEKLSGNNQQFCNKCRRLNDADYFTSIYSTSNILILILNYGKGILFECDVEFDEKINISKFVENQGCPVNYRLLGIIVHIGPSSMDGHFIAYCRGIENKEQWYKFNDGMVTQASFSELKNAGMPYVLFYENINSY